jgi:hypothetical protein
MTHSKKRPGEENHLQPGQTSSGTNTNGRIILVTIGMDEDSRRRLASNGFIRIGQREDKAALASGLEQLVWSWCGRAPGRSQP